MSKVEGSENKVVQRNQDDYKTKEKQLTKKHRKELRQLTESHRQEMDVAQENHQKSVNDLKDRNRQTLSKRELQYQDDIKQISEMHRNSMRKALNEEENKRSNVEGNLQRELMSTKNKSDLQMDNLRKTHRQDVEERNRQLTEIVTNAKSQSHEAYENQRNKILKKKEQEAELGRQAQQKQLVDFSKKNDDLKRARENDVSSLQRKKDGEIRRITDSYESNVFEERKAHAEALDSQREGFTESTRRIREKFQGAEDEGRAGREQNLEDFKAKVNERVQTRIDNLERQLASERRDGAVQRDKLMKRANLEKRNVAEEIYRSNDDLRRQRDMTKSVTQEKTHQEIAKVRKDSEDLIGDTNKYFRHKMQMTDLKNSESFENLKAYSKEENEHIRSTTEERLRRLKDAKETENRTMQNYFERQIDQSEANKAELLTNERARKAKDLGEIQNRMKSEMRKQQAQFSEKYSQLTSSYEQQLAELRMNSADELKRAREAGERRMNEQAKGFRMEIQNSQDQNEAKLKQLSERYELELNAQEKRYQAQIDHLTGALKPKR